MQKLCCVCNKPALPYASKGNIELKTLPCCQSNNCRAALLRTPFNYIEKEHYLKVLCEYLTNIAKPTKAYRQRLLAALPHLELENVSVDKRTLIVRFPSFHHEFLLGNGWVIRVDNKHDKLSVLKTPKESIEHLKGKLGNSTAPLFMPFFKIWDNRYRMTKTAFHCDRAHSTFKENNIIEIRESRYRVLSLSPTCRFLKLQECTTGSTYYNVVLSHAMPNIRKVYKENIQRK